jgi:Sulfotransferase family
MRINVPTNDGEPPPLKEKGALYFLHIPKTAGTSVTKWLTDHLDQGSICPAKNWDQLLMIDPQELAKYRLFAGHFGVDLEPFLQRKITTVTLLRDPLKRTISHYRHVRRDIEHPLHKHVLHQSFDMFVMDKANWPMIDNFQARYLVSAPIAFKQLRNSYDRNVAKRNRLSVLSEDARYLLDPKYVREKALEATTTNLGCVGTDECLPDFLGWIGEQLVIQTSLSIHEIPRENIAPQDDGGEPSAISLEIVETLTNIDKEIYTGACM